MTKSHFLQGILLILAILGLVFPTLYIVQYFTELGRIDWGSFMTDATINPAAQGLVVDLRIVFLAYVAWLIPEGRKLGMRWWVYLLITCTTSAAFGIPLFLLMRERRLQALEMMSVSEKQGES